MESIGLFIIAVLAIAGFCVYFIPSFIARKDVNFSKIFLLNLLGAWTGILWVAALCWALFFARPRAKEPERRERMLLNLLKSMGGRGTPTEIAAGSSFSAEEAKDELDLLCEKGLAELQVTDGGNLVYTLLGVLSDAEKRSGRSPLDV